uniref:PDZ domain-containing protein n=1 Tax=Alexandrium andersonii TaxID=327968 RepID=A0A7S2F4S2_9DINO
MWGPCCCSDECGGASAQVVVTGVRPTDHPDVLPPLKQPDPVAKEVQEEPRVTLLFQLPDDAKTEKMVELKLRPLGVGFRKKTPLTVSDLRQGEEGERIGIKPGWVLLEVNGERVVEMAVPQSAKLLNRAVQELPREGRLDLGRRAQV